MPRFFSSYNEHQPPEESFNNLVRGLGGVSGAFNLIAPVAIYHLTDIRWRSEAFKAVKILADKATVIPSVKTLVFPDTSVEDLAGLKVSRTREGQDELLDQAFPNIRLLYNQLFAGVVETNLIGLFSFVIDQYGAFGYVLGEESFYGDELGLFPYYGDAATLVGRCTAFCEVVNG